jgi:hypothetical protein
LARHFDNNAEFFKDKVVFYHDSDIIFNYLPDFQTLCTDDVVYQSDTHFYLDYTYLRNKEKQGNLPEHEAVDLLAKIGRVTEKPFNTMMETLEVLKLCLKMWMAISGEM